ncbi:hypothetical protein Nhal_4032 (plasmid) [Nitrosococcus halophilus Nc 4]|uniref:Uncharacterized protein n=1 Tax=Nitrosococcus halophilus (strain Nc4) TaxID=472759 RepID=D5C5I4_NITHN|nr:hypothetical protein [Nitrosococcus halophilus]ADE17038.1 hypothetical protein Nhal_4032 [Nitrosococcus halophilus Nc 4]
MSMPSGYVRCHGCDFEGVMQRRPITLEYVLPGGAVVQGYRVFSWCSSCENVTEAEEAFDTDSIQAEIDSLRQQQVGFIGRLFGGGKAEDVEIKRLRGRLQLAQLRQSGPRCLRCGETTVVPLAFDESGTSSIVHTCGRRLFMVPEDPDAPRFMFRPEAIRLDPEGWKI